MTAPLGRRLHRLEAAHDEDRRQRITAAGEALFRTMEPAHGEAVSAWLGRPEVRATLCTRGTPLLERLAALEAPALAQAFVLLTMCQVEQGLAGTLAPEIAQVYPDDPDALPVAPCRACGYPMPTRCGRDRRGGLIVLALYEGQCPICGGEHTVATAMRSLDIAEEGT